MTVVVLSLHKHETCTHFNNNISSVTVIRHSHSTRYLFFSKKMASIDPIPIQILVEKHQQEQLQVTIIYHPLIENNFF